MHRAIVAPLAGAWIEMQKFLTELYRKGVAPLAGAWIEICVGAWRRQMRMSRPSRARGLKYAVGCDGKQCSGVAPLAGAWIEILSAPLCAPSCRSRAPRGRVD